MLDMDNYAANKYLDSEKSTGKYIHLQLEDNYYNIKFTWSCSQL